MSFFFSFLDLKTPSYSRNRHDGSMENNRKAAPGASDACRVSCIWLLPVCNLYLFFFNVKTDMTVAVTQALQSCVLRRYCPPAEYLHKLPCMILTGEVLQGLQSSGSGRSATCHLGGARRESLQTAWCGAGLGRRCTVSGGCMRCRQHLHR